MDPGLSEEETPDARSESDRQSVLVNDGGEPPPDSTRVTGNRKIPECVRVCSLRVSLCRKSLDYQIIGDFAAHVQGQKA